MEQTKTIKTENGELYVQGDVIIGRMETKGKVTKWFKGDKLHRDGDLPAFIERNKAGAVKCEEYYRDGKEHREGGLPAYIVRNKAGVVTREVYYRDGKEHREGGLPAYIVRNKAGAVTLEEYWRDGVIVPAEHIAAKKSQELASINEKFTQELAAAKAELTAERAKVADLQAQLDQLKQKIKAILE